VPAIFRKAVKALKAMRSMVAFKNWGRFLMDRSGLLGGFYILRTRGGLQFKVRAGTKDCAILQEVLLENCYSPDPEFEIHDGDTVVDVGAHAGVFSASAAAKAPRGRVYSLEPFPSNFHLLEENVRLNGLKNVQTLMLGLADSAGIRRLYLDPRNSGGHSILPRSDRESVTIATSTLEGFLMEHGLERVNFMKVDCEGAEYEILTSASRKVLDRIDRIVLEYHGTRESAERVLENHLSACGFAVRKVPILRDLGMLYARRVG
jgi:FkbM family methyltransferase